MESPSVGGAQGGHSDWSDVKSSSVSKSGEAVIGQTLLEPLMSDVGVVVDFMECFANAFD